VKQDIVTTKIKRESLRKLKAIAALKQETMLAVLARLIDAELERTLLQEKHSP
jgi:prophage DNA circulation protein